MLNSHIMAVLSPHWLSCSLTRCKMLVTFTFKTFCFCRQWPATGKILWNIWWPVVLTVTSKMSLDSLQSLLPRSWVMPTCWKSCNPMGLHQQPNWWPRCQSELQKLDCFLWFWAQWCTVKWSVLPLRCLFMHSTCLHPKFFGCYNHYHRCFQGGENAHVFNGGLIISGWCQELEFGQSLVSSPHLFVVVEVKSLTICGWTEAGSFIYLC